MLAALAAAGLARRWPPSPSDADRTMPRSHAPAAPPGARFVGRRPRVCARIDDPRGSRWSVSTSREPAGSSLQDLPAAGLSGHASVRAGETLLQLVIIFCAVANAVVGMLQLTVDLGRFGLPLYGGSLIGGLQANPFEFGALIAAARSHCSSTLREPPPRVVPACRRSS